MAWTLCSSGNAILKAGIHVNSDVSSGATDIASFSTEAEGRICAEMRKDVVNNPPTDTQIVNAITDVCSSMIAMDIISYDPTGFLAREADMLMNKNDDRVNKGLIKLKEKENQRFPPT